MNPTTTASAPGTHVFASVCSAGGRPINEDALFADAARGLFLVVDGRGGAGKGDRASALAVKAFEHATTPGLDAVHDAHERILAAQRDDPTLKGMGATFALASLQGNRAEIAHAGEVRAYVVGPAGARRLTEDDSLATQLVKLRQIAPEEAENHPARKSIQQYLGKEGGPKISRQVVDLRAGELLVLATDGFYRFMANDDWIALAAPGAQGVGLAARLQAAVERAIAAGSDDNLTAVAIAAAGQAQGPPSFSEFQAGIQDLLQKLLQSTMSEHELSAFFSPLLQPIAVNAKARHCVVMAEHAGLRVVLGEFGESPRGPLSARVAWPEVAPAVDGPPAHLPHNVVAVALLEEQGASQTKILGFLELHDGAAYEPIALGPLREIAPWLGVLARILALKTEGTRLARRFDVLNELGRAVASSLNIDDVLHVLLEQTLRLTKASLAYVIMPEGDTLQCRAGLDHHGQRVGGLEISHTLARRVLESREPICILDTGADEASQTASVMSLNLQSVMCVPLIVKEQLIGLLYVSSNMITRTFTSQDLDLLIAIANQTALSVQNALYVSEMEEKKRMEVELDRIGKEMEIATRIQAMLVPSALEISGFELDMAQVTATEVGGDLIDYLPQPDGRFWLAVGDVTGHGLTPGLIMMMAQSMITGLVTMKPDAKPSELLVALNWALYNNVRDRLRNDHYMTLQLLHHAGGGQFEACGLHCEILLYRARTGLVETIELPGVWTGFLPDVWELTTDHRFGLDPGDVMLLFTDGLIEAMDATGEQYDLERLKAALVRHADDPVGVIKERVLGEVRAFLHEQLDDISLIVLRRSRP